MRWDILFIYGEGARREVTLPYYCNIVLIHKEE